MTYLNGAGILDKVLLFLSDNSATMRAKCLGWLSMAGVDISERRPWKWLYQTAASQTITNSVLTLPNDYRMFVSITFSDQGTYEFTESLTTLTFTPSVPAGVTCDMTYVPVVADFADTSTATIWPYYSRNALVFGTLANAFMFEKDPALAIYPEQYEKEIAKFKEADNMQTAIPTYKNIGYPQRNHNLQRSIV